MKTLSSNKRPEAQRHMLAKNSPNLNTKTYEFAIKNNTTALQRESDDVFENKPNTQETPPKSVLYTSNSLLQVTESSEEDLNADAERYVNVKCMINTPQLHVYI